jgi:hypothetical protein
MCVKMGFSCRPEEKEIIGFDDEDIKYLAKPQRLIKVGVHSPAAARAARLIFLL